MCPCRGVFREFLVGCQMPKPGSKSSADVVELVLSCGGPGCIDLNAPPATKILPLANNVEE